MTVDGGVPTQPLRLVEYALKQWLVEFLERDGLELLLHSLELQCGQAARQRSLSVSDALTQAQCVQCIRAAINSDTGLRYIIDRRDYVRQLATALESQNITVKMQVFELLCAMCMYSAKGHAMALDALQHLKVTRAQRYRFDIIMNELRNTENVAYQTRLLSFINCLTLCHNNLQKRVRVRNEFLGLGLGPILRSLCAIDDKELQVQVSAFTNHQHQDELELESTDKLTHHQLFESIFQKIADKPQAIWFYAMLQNLAQLDPSNPNADNVWEALEALSSEAVTPDFSFYKKPPQNTNVSTSLNYKRRVRRCWTINVPQSDDVKETCTVATQTESDDIGEATQPSDLEEQQQLSSAEPAGPPSAPPPPPPPPPPPMPSLPPPPPPPPMPSLPPPPPPPPPMPSLTPVIPSDSEVPPPSPLAGPSSVQESKVPPPPPIPSTSGFETPVSRRFASGYLTYPTRHSLPADLTDSASLWTPLKDKCNTLPMPRRKMRTLNWTKLPSSVIGDTVWTEVQSKAKNLTVDFKQMEELFCQKTANVKRPKSSPGTLPSPVNPKITLLETKRDLAVNIYLKQFKSGGKAVVDAIKNLKGGDIGIEKLRALLPLLPTEKELTSVRAYSGDLDRLGEAEKFYLQLSEVPSFALRIRAMLLKEEFPSRTSELKEQLEAVADASSKLMTNEHLKEFLALVLQLGNYINAGSYAGNAAGFTLSTLPKLLEIKANKPRLTLLHYVVDVAESNNKEILQFTEEMSNMKEIARISLELLQDEVLKVTSDVKHVESQLKKDKSGIRSQFKDFLKSALKCSNELQQAMEKVKACSCALAKHFCEDPQKFQPEECFSLFADFFSVIERARLENEQKKKEEERRIREEREQNRAGGNRSRGRARRISPDRQYTAVERILRDICTGNFKLRRSELN